MLEKLYYTILAVAIPAVYLIFSIAYRRKIPAFGSKLGVKTKMTSRNQRTWEEGHRYAAGLFAVYAAVLGALCAAWLIFPWGDKSSAAFWCYAGIEFISIVSIIPLINRHIREKMNLKWVK